MALLKEDGSLDIERINSLPYEEYMDAMGYLTQEQVQEYLSKLPLDESDEPMQAVVVDYPKGVEVDEVINNFRNNMNRNKRND